MSQSEKVAIFGGGIAGLTAAYALTDPSLATRYEVTVYQMGWRLGGKGASGRNRERHDRIEEHGLHIWLGCYENAFRVMRTCYDECRRANLTPDSPFQSVEDAFDPQDLITMMEPDGAGSWDPWSITMPSTGKFPGQQSQCISVAGAVRRLLELMDKLQQVPLDRMSPERLGQVRQAKERLDDSDCQNCKQDYRAVLQSLESLQIDSKRSWAAEDQTPEQRRRAILIELAITLGKGVLRDVLLEGHTSFDVLDQHDFRGWLRQHGASRQACDSAPVRAAYEIVFGYHRGEDDKPSYAAGVATRFMLRWVLTYEGSLIYKMRAGMGDIIFSPLYLMLKNRGVEFKFFHRLDTVSLSPDKSHVASVSIDRQVDLETPQYDPLTWIKGVPCWPSEPMYERDDGTRQIPLAQQQAIQALAEEHPGLEPLESAYSPWASQEKLELRHGTDFDKIVLAVALGALPLHCQELIENSPDLRKMVLGMPTIGTQSFQLWMSEDRHGLGWQGDATILDSYLDSWADFSHLEAVESFPPQTVKSIAYFSRTLPEPDAPPPVGPNPAYPVERTEWVKRSRRDEFLGGATGMKPIWTDSYTAEGEFRWDRLVDLQSPESVGKDRFDAQFWCANVNPTDRYIQSLAGTTQYRVGAGESGFENVVLAGDWIRTGLNVGCIESATNGGLMAARAICGQPVEISGEFDFCPRTSGCFTSLLAIFSPLLAWVRKLCRICCPPPPPAPLPTPSLPMYVERGGDQSFPAPFEFKTVDAFAFHLSAPASALQRLCDAHLNAPTGGRLSYVAPFSSVMMVFSNIARSRPSLPPASEYGWLPEKNFSIWIPLIAMESTSTGIPWPRAIVWYQPYIMVDQAWALTSGREVYGYPKALADVTIPGFETDQTAFGVKTLAVEAADPAAEVRRLELLKIRPTSSSAVPSGRQFDQTQAADLVEDMKRKVLVEPEAHNNNSSAVESRVDTLLSLTDLTGVFLKQFRDAGVGNQACYQAIVEADAKPSFLGGGSLSDSYQVEGIDTITHPFLADFGWSGFPREVANAWHVKFNFTMQAGREVWRA
ncbi:NAD(P)-binding protein [Rosistilla oblonga]|uniref:NAD(P)-binding protein n=1 Tax=Rosistilla oblonga TaxID=2527990 RepID=UPI003A97E00F